MVLLFSASQFSFKLHLIHLTPLSHISCERFQEEWYRCRILNFARYNRYIHALTNGKLTFGVLQRRYGPRNASARMPSSLYFLLTIRMSLDLLAINQLRRTH